MKEDGGFQNDGIDVLGRMAGTIGPDMRLEASGPVRMAPAGVLLPHFG